ncbi:MAG: nodulation protein NfeD, partial [Lentisphaerae bacterium]|nr:nodulation protein NfeD [Lentisphaerota bacterium]
RPSGVVVINDKRYHVVTRGELIAAKTAITVVEVHGNRIVVEAVEQQSNENMAGEQK